MKRKALNKSRSVYLNQNTPLNIIPEKKLKKAHTGTLMENRGKSRFRFKKIRERISALIRSELVFKNKTNQLAEVKQLRACGNPFAKPGTCFARANPLQSTFATLCFAQQRVANVLCKGLLRTAEGFHQAKQVVHLNNSSAPVKETEIKSLSLKGVGNPTPLTHTGFLVNESLAQTKLPPRRGFSSSRFLCKTSTQKRKAQDETQKLGFLYAWNPYDRPFLSFKPTLSCFAKPSGLQRAGRKPKASKENSPFARPQARVVCERENSSKLPNNCALQATQRVATRALQGLPQPALPQKGFSRTGYKGGVGTPTRVYQNEKVKIHSQDLKQLVEGRGRKVSPYKARLLERNKLSLIYGNLGWRELRRCVLQSKHRKGVSSPSSGNKKTRPQTSSLPENLVTLLESRLDVVVYRCRFFPSFYSCKQAINHGKVFVNKSQVRITGHLLKPGDLIQVVPRKAFSNQGFVSQNPSLSSSTLEKSANLANLCKGIATGTQEKVVAKQPQAHVGALEIEKQRTLLGLQNRIKVRSFWPSLPSFLLTRFHPLNKTPWNGKQSSQDNQQPGVTDIHNTCFACLGNQLDLSPQPASRAGKVYERIAKHASQTGEKANHFTLSNHWLPVYRKGLVFQAKQDVFPCANLTLASQSKGCKHEVEKLVARETLPFKETLFYTHQKGLFERGVMQNRPDLEENKGKTSSAQVRTSNTLFLDFKEKKRILRDLLQRDCKAQATGSKKGLNDVNTTTKPLPVRDNPSLFLRFQSENSLQSFAKGLPQARKGGANSTAKGFARCKGSRDCFPSSLVPRKVRPFPKPLNLEISYQTLTAVFLYPPQRVHFPAHIDLEMIGKSI